MFSSAIILSATVLVEGTKFRWWVTDGAKQWLTVGHPDHGTVTLPLSRGPEPQARDMARELFQNNRAKKRRKRSRL
jgi:hypothetical protein